MICTDPSCGCGIASDSLTITGSGAAGDPYQIESNAFGIVTSATRPATPFVGQFIWETDTQRQLVWTGANWLIVAGAFPAWNLTRKSTDAVQSIPDSTSTDVSMLNEVEDSNAFHTGTAAVVTIPAGYGGDYMITAGLQFSGHATGYRFVVVSFGTNATTTSEIDFFRGFVVPASATANNAVSTSKRVRLEAGATATISSFQSSGGALDITRAYFTGAMTRHIPTLT